VKGPSQRLLDNTQPNKRQTRVSPAGFEPALPTSEQPETQAADRAATAIGQFEGFNVL